MKKLPIFCILCLMLAACSAGTAEVQPPAEPSEAEPSVQQEAKPFCYKDAFGKEYSAANELEIFQRFTYGRKSSGYFVDNRSHPELFDEEGFHGDREAPEVVYEWRRYQAHKNEEDWLFQVGDASSVLWVNGEGELLGLREQRMTLSGVNLTGILRWVTETDARGSAYALNYFEGELYFYPDPAAMGDFPMMILDDSQRDLDYSHTSGGFAPLRIYGSRSSYQAWADTLRIKVDPLPQEELEALFADSDLIEVEIALDQVDFLHAPDFPLYSRAQVESLVKLGDL